MTKEEQNFNKWFDEYADGVKVFEETDMKMAYLQGCADEVEKWEKINGELRTQLKHEWHDLRKDPTDEPKKDGEYLVQVMCIMFNNVEYCVGRYWKEENRWEGEQLRGLLVTKWKEIE